MNRTTITAGRKVFMTGGACLALSLALLSPAGQAQQAGDTSRPFGTLFTTPDERDYLDYLRQDFVNKSQSASFNIQEDVIPEIPVQEEPEQEAADITQYKFGGIMTRLNGTRMIWLNGKQITEADLPDNMSLVNAGGTTILNILANGQSYQLKPGQSVDISGNATPDAADEQDNTGTGTAPAQPGALAPIPDVQSQPNIVYRVDEPDAEEEDAQNGNARPERDQVVNDILNAVDLDDANEQEAGIVEAMLNELDRQRDNAQQNPAP